MSDLAGVEPTDGVTVLPAAGTEKPSPTETTAPLDLGDTDEDQAPSVSDKEDAEPVKLPEDGTAFEYQPTGDAGLDLALQFVGRQGFSPEHPAMKAAQAGDFTLIKALMASKGQAAAGWEQMLALAEQAFGRHQASVKEAQAKATAAIHEAAGGPEAWSTLQAWAAKEADPAERAQINAMLSAGSVQARAAVLLLQQAYSSRFPAAEQLREPKSAVKASAASNGPTNNGPLNGAQYRAAVNELIGRKGTWSLESDPEYLSLRSRFTGS